MTRPRFQIPDYPRDRMTVPEFRAYYAELVEHTLPAETHIVFDDGNIEKHHVTYYADRGTRASRLIHQAFLTLTPTQRRKVVRRLPHGRQSQNKAWFKDMPLNLGHCPDCGEKMDVVTLFSTQYLENSAVDYSESYVCNPCRLSARWTWNYDRLEQNLNVNRY